MNKGTLSQIRMQARQQAIKMFADFDHRMYGYKDEMKGRDAEMLELLSQIMQEPEPIPDVEAYDMPAMPDIEPIGEVPMPEIDLGEEYENG